MLTHALCRLLGGGQRGAQGRWLESRPFELSSERDGDEVAQAYLKQTNASVPVPLVRLAAFERVFIPAGKSVTVQLSVTPETHVAVLDNGF